MQIKHANLHGFNGFVERWNQQLGATELLGPGLAPKIILPNTLNLWLHAFVHGSLNSTSFRSI